MQFAQDYFPFQSFKFISFSPLVLLTYMIIAKKSIDSDVCLQNMSIYCLNKLKCQFHYFAKGDIYALFGQNTTRTLYKSNIFIHVFMPLFGNVGLEDVEPETLHSDCLFLRLSSVLQLYNIHFRIYRQT